MIDIDKIRMVVARYFDVPEATVTESFLFPVQRLQGSVARATLHAALKRLAGADLPSSFTATTFGQLINPTTPAPEAASPVSKPAASQAAPATRRDAPAIGIDIELCDKLPWSGDPWTDAFYLENFTRAEIAYCVRQTDPKQSFCGLWSAKEAAIKCGPPFAGLRPIEIEITHDENGKPAIPQAKECAISISHSSNIAVGVCVLLPQTRR